MKKQGLEQPIAIGNQVENGIWALFVMAARIIIQQIILKYLPVPTKYIFHLP